VQLTFYGAAGEVTGSCFLVQANGQRLLLDCGLIQGRRQDQARNREPFAFDPADIDAVVLSHAHLDHSGRIPLLIRAGFRGPVHTQAASRDLCRILLQDAGALQEKDAEWESRKRERKGLPPIEPLYTREDALAAMASVRALPYDRADPILPGITVTLRDAGHILGSAIVELDLAERGEGRRLVFSGDLGQRGAPILRDPTQVRSADAVLLESTYGQREHRSSEATLAELGEVIGTARHDRGNILVPAFAVGRAQELLYLFARHYDEWGMDRWQVFLDSPMAIEATRVYTRHRALHDAETGRLWEGLAAHELLPNLRFTASAKESAALNRIRGGAIIIAGSGMCTGGRIQHHLKHHAWRSSTQILMVGFQARGTPGRALVDGARHLRLWGETIRVAARVHTIGGLSAHADRSALVEWYDAIPGAPPLWLVHGEEDARSALAEALHARCGVRARLPVPGETVDLLEPGP